MVGGNWLKSIFFLFLDHLPGFPNYTFLNIQKKFFSLHPNVDEHEQKLNERILTPVPVPFSKEDFDVLANKVHLTITKSYKAAYPMQKSLRKKDNIWWNSELASIRKGARPAWRKAIKTKQEKDWESQKLGLAYFKKAVKRAKRNSWHSFVDSMNSQTPTTRLVKMIQRNETVRVSKVIKHNGEFMKSPQET